MLRGARQTGKTEAVRRLAENFDLFLELNAGQMADEQLTVRMPEGELSYRLLSLPLYLAEKLPALELGGALEN